MAVLLYSICRLMIMLTVRSLGTKCSSHSSNNFTGFRTLRTVTENSCIIAGYYIIDS